ncbi:Uncharacterized protein YR821_2387 [Yersinia ruckeri]|nr:hypothetical protein yruck0001_8650 [Yersinia ruckeri ATCC 29473]QTD77305.1 Uncharacterized protein YR821_2387 [Yersinia ruckeri]
MMREFEVFIVYFMIDSRGLEDKIIHALMLMLKPVDPEAPILPQFFKLNTHYFLYIRSL